MDDDEEGEGGMIEREKAGEEAEEEADMQEELEEEESLIQRRLRYVLNRTNYTLLDI